MQIRTRLTLRFLLLGGLIMIIVCAAIYYSSATYRKQNFYYRLTGKAWSISKLLFDTYGYDAERVRRMERNNPDKMQNEKIIILDFKNDTLYTSDETGEIEIRNNVIERVRTGERIRYRQGSYDVLAVLYMTANNRYVVLAAATDTEGSSYLKILRLIMVIVLLISLVLFFIAGWYYAGRALKPISDMVREVEEISITSLNLRVPEGNGIDEIGRLAKTFNRMLERLESSFAMQKNFIANASHELRTPLTAINGQIEVLMMKDRTTGEYRRELISVQDDIRSLIYLANRLLLIARTSAEGPATLIKNIQVDEILWQSRDEMTRFNNKYKINVSVDESLTDSGQLIVKGDEFLIKTALSNIMDNACKYSEDHTVNVIIKSSGRWIELKFKDHGIGIPEEEIEKVFEPFYRASNALTVSGSGIGLQLVSQIIRNHNGEIEISSAVNKGTTVTIKLPVAG
ncbi:MAG: HAMP domain-containing sensor histidine kinase [Bacteroidota bacterium]